MSEAEIHDAAILLPVLLLLFAVMCGFMFHSSAKKKYIPQSVGEMSPGDVVRAKIANRQYHDDGKHESLWLEIKHIIHHEQKLVCNLLDHPKVLQFKRKDDEVEIHHYQIEDYVKRNGDSDVIPAFSLYISYLY